MNAISTAYRVPHGWNVIVGDYSLEVRAQNGYVFFLDRELIVVSVGTVPHTVGQTISDITMLPLLSLD